MPLDGGGTTRPSTGRPGLPLPRHPLAKSEGGEEAIQ